MQNSTPDRDDLKAEDVEDTGLHDLSDLWVDLGGSD